MKKNRRWMAALLMGILFSMALSLGASAAANKAVRMKVSYTVQKSPMDFLKNTYIAEAQLPKSGKLSTSQTMSAKVVIPEALLKNEGDNLEAALSLGIGHNIGGVDAIYWIELTKKDGKVLLQKRTMKNDKRSAAGKYADLKEVNGKYILTLKNIPIKGNARYNNKDISFSKLAAKKKSWQLYLQFALIGNVTKKTGSQYIYVDEISLKTDKTKKITVDSSKEYTSWQTLRFDGKTVAAKIVKTPV